MGGGCNQLKDAIFVITLTWQEKSFPERGGGKGPCECILLLFGLSCFERSEHLGSGVLFLFLPSKASRFVSWSYCCCQFVALRLWADWHHIHHVPLYNGVFFSRIKPGGGHTSYLFYLPLHASMYFLSLKPNYQNFLPQNKDVKPFSRAKFDGRGFFRTKISLNLVMTLVTTSPLQHTHTCSSVIHGIISQPTHHEGTTSKNYL